jgi:hypothetical protein
MRASLADEHARRSGLAGADGGDSAYASARAWPLLVPPSPQQPDGSNACGCFAALTAYALARAPATICRLSRPATPRGGG